MTASLTRRMTNGLIAALSNWADMARLLDRSTRQVRIDRLSSHVLRDLGLSEHEVRDFAAEERARFLG